MAKGLIVYFDGPDGVGKTTQLKMAEQAFAKDGRSVYSTHVLGGSPVADALREIMFSDYDRPALTDMHIAAACQYASIPELLKRRDNGEIVLVDRSPLSIVAYQVYGDGLDKEKGYGAARELLDASNPDLVLLFTAQTDTLARRRQQQDEHKAADHFHKKAQGYHMRVSGGYIHAAKEFNVRVVEAEDGPERVFASTIKLLRAALGS